MVKGAIGQGILQQQWVWIVLIYFVQLGFVGGRFVLAPRDFLVHFVLFFARVFGGERFIVTLDQALIIAAAQNHDVVGFLLGLFEPIVAVEGFDLVVFLVGIVFEALEVKQIAVDGLADDLPRVLSPNHRRNQQRQRPSPLHIPILARIGRGRWYDEPHMDLGQIFRPLKEYATWEILGAGGGYLMRSFRKNRAVQADTDKATKEGAMFLTPDGWQTDKLRFENSDPIKPR